MLGQGLEALRDCRSRATAPHAVLLLALLLTQPVPLGKSTAAGQFSRFDVDHEEALALDQDRHRHRRQPPGVLEGLQLVELKDPAQAAALGCERQAPEMEVLAVLAQELESMRDRLAVAAQDPGRLSVGDLGDQGAEQVMMEERLLEAVVDAEGLGGEGALALQAQEALDGAAVAGSEVAALEAPASVAGFEGGAVLARAMRRLESHRRSFLPGRGQGWVSSGATARTSCGGEVKRENPSVSLWTQDSGGGQIHRRSSSQPGRIPSASTSPAQAVA